MTRTTEQNSLQRLQYTADNPDPRFRPVVSAVMQKLREMKVFDDERAAAFIIDDLIYTHLVREPHRDQLFYLLQQVYSYWGRVGFGAMVQIPKPEEGQNAVTRADLPEKVSLPGPDFSNPKVKGAVEEIIGLHQYTPDPFVHGEIPRCDCGQEFEFREQWKRHVRIRIWKALER